MTKLEVDDNQPLSSDLGIINHFVADTYNAADVLPWDGSWSQEWPQQLQDNGDGVQNLDGLWPTQCYPTYHNDGQMGWNEAMMHHGASQAYASYTPGSQLTSQDTYSASSSPTTYCQPSPSTNYDYRRPSMNTYQLVDLSRDSTQSTQSSGTSNSKKPRGVIEPATSHRTKSKTNRRTSTHHKGHSQRSQAAKTPNKGSDDDETMRGDNHKRVQERNRVAANKFRTRKREDAVKLRADEEKMESHHRRLSSSVKKLTQEVYQLKLQLLQHSDCNCTLIQNYIKSEAQRYIKQM